MKKTGLVISFICLLLFGCRKNVTPEMPEYEQKLVIEASIETGSPAMVYLSHSVPYFGSFDYTNPELAFVKGAHVTISDGNVTETLIEVDPTYGFVYAGATLLGKEGRTYSIRVTYEGRTFETTSTILHPPKLDSIWFRSEIDTLGFIWQKFSESPGTGDCYRWFAKRLGRDMFYAAPFNSAFDDKFIDGQKFEFAYDRGRQPVQGMDPRDDWERGYYKKGDTVVVKFCRIGRREYDFWMTYYQNKTSNSNPFSAPANIKSMFDDYRNCFGSFVAYAPSFDTIIIPED
jgi:hypothetical protein